MVPSGRMDIARTECKGTRELDCEANRPSRDESRA
jgi:hypothetical protein